MAESLSRDRLYPSLLDRLVDDDPGRATEPREARAVSLQKLRDNVLRDLNWLFNATQAGEEGEAFEQALDVGVDALAAGRGLLQREPPGDLRMLAREFRRGVADVQQFLAVVTEESGVHVQGALASRTCVRPLSRSISVRM